MHMPRSWFREEKINKIHATFLVQVRITYIALGKFTKDKNDYLILWMAGYKTKKVKLKQLPKNTTLYIFWTIKYNYT